MRPRLMLAAILISVLLASCGSRPDVSVSIAGKAVPMVLTSTTEGTGCQYGHGDAVVGTVPLTTVPASKPVTLRFEAGAGASEIRGWIYDLEAPSSSGGPIEEFTLPGRSGEFTPRSILPSRAYSVVVNVRWSFLLTRGEVTHIFRVRSEPP